MTTKLINLCPHDITIVDGDGNVIEVLPHEEGRLARVSVKEVPVENTLGRPFPVVRREWGEVVGLPDPQPEVAFVVSAAGVSACPGRADLFSPGRLIRDEHGQPTQCVGLVANT